MIPCLLRSPIPRPLSFDARAYSCAPAATLFRLLWVWVGQHPKKKRYVLHVIFELSQDCMATSDEGVPSVSMLQHCRSMLGRICEHDIRQDAVHIIDVLQRGRIILKALKSQRIRTAFNGFEQGDDKARGRSTSSSRSRGRRRRSRSGSKSKVHCYYCPHTDKDVDSADVV